MSDQTVGLGQWNFGDGEKDLTLTTAHNYTLPGTYFVNFNYKNEDGCPSPNKTLSVVVYEQPKANFTFPNYVTISSPNVLFVNVL